MAQIPSTPPAQATIAIGIRLVSSLEKTDETDIYDVQLQAGHRYLFELKSAGAQPIAFTGLSIFGFDAAHGAAIGLNDVGNVLRETSMIALEAAPDTSYSVQVTNSGFVGFSEPVVGGYELVFHEVPLDDHADILNAATPLPMGSTQSGVFDLPWEIDMFRIDLVGGTRYQYTIHGTGSQPVGAATLSLLSADGTRLQASGPSATASDRIGNFVAPASGSYYLDATFNHHQDKSGWVGGGYVVSIDVNGTSHSTPGADILDGGSGDSVLDGGAGVDLAVFAHARNTYVLTKKTGGWQVSTSFGDEGTDQLVNIERLKFSNAYVALDLDGHAGTTAKVIGALFGTAALKNKGYVGIGLGLLDQGMSYQNLVSLAVQSAPFVQLAGTHSNNDFVKLVYKNLFGNTPSAADLKTYVGLLDSGSYTQADLAYMACETSVNAAHIGLIGLSTTGIEYTPAG